MDSALLCTAMGACSAGQDHNTELQQALSNSKTAVTIAVDRSWCILTLKDVTGPWRHNSDL